MIEMLLLSVMVIVGLVHTGLVFLHWRRYGAAIDLMKLKELADGGNQYARGLRRNITIGWLAALAYVLVILARAS